MGFDFATRLGIFNVQPLEVSSVFVMRRPTVEKNEICGSCSKDLNTAIKVPQIVN